MCPLFFAISVPMTLARVPKPVNGCSSAASAETMEVAMDMPGHFANRAVFSFTRSREMLRFLALFAAMAALPVLGSERPAPKPAAAKARVPDQAALDAAEKRIRDVFGQELSQAYSAEQDLALSLKLAKLASETTDNLAARYVLFRMAAQRACAAGKLSAALLLADRLAESYDVDVLTMKADLVAELADLLTTRKRRLAEGENLPQTIGSLVKEAVAEDQYPVAKRLVDLAVAGARKARNAQFVREFTDRAKEVETFCKQYERIAPSVQRLVSDPSDPAANLAVGSWHCFRKGDWPRGLPFLAQGNDPALAPLAQRELAASPLPSPGEGPGVRAGSAKAAAPTDLLALANAWADLAKSRPEPQRTEIQSHAACCLRLALPKLTGLDKPAAEKRLQELEADTTDATAPRWSARGVVQKGNVALASNGTTVSGRIERGPELLDGNSIRYDGSTGFAHSAAPCEWTIAFKTTYLIREIRLLLWNGKAERFYRYAIALSVNGTDFMPLVDRSRGEWRGWQTIEFPPRPVKAIKLTGLAGNYDQFHVVEFEAYCVSPKFPR